MPNLVISSPEDVSHMPFQRSRNAMARYSAKQKARRCRRCTTGLFKTITYELRARPDADPSKIFDCVIKADHDTDKLAFLMDDYAQYRFKNQIEEPFLEILQKSTDLRGAARSSRIPPMSYRNWRFDDIDDYINNGFANRLSRIIARPRSATMPIMRSREPGEDPTWEFSRRPSERR